MNGYRRTWFNNWSNSEGTSYSETESYSESFGESEIASEMQSISGGTSTSISHVYDEDGFPTGTYNVSVGDSHAKVDAKGVTIGNSHATSSSYSTTHSTSSSQSRGMSEGLEPILKDYFGGVHSLDNVRHMAIARLRSIPPRNAVVKSGATPSFDISTKFMKSPLVSREAIAAFEQRAFKKSPYTIEGDRASAMLKEQQRELYLAADSYRPGPRSTPAFEAVMEDDDDGLG